MKITPDVLNKGKPYTCKKCGKDVFTQNVKLIKISKLLAGNSSGHDLISPQPVWQCVSCKRVVNQKDLSRTSDPTTTKK